MEADDAVLGLLSRIDLLCKQYAPSSTSTPSPAADLVARLSKENADLRKALRDAQEAALASDDVVARLSKENVDLRKALQAAGERESRSRQQGEAQQIDAYEQRIKALEAESYAAVQAKGQLEIRLARLDVDASSAVRSREESEARQNDLKETVAKLKSDLNVAQQSLGDKIQALTENEQELTATKKVLEQTQRSSDSLLNKLETTQEGLSSSTSRIRAIEGDLVAAQTELKSAQQEAVKNQRQLEIDLEEARRGVAISQGDAASTIAQARQAQQSAEARLRDLETSLNDLRAHKMIQEENLSKVSADLESKVSAVAILTTRLSVAEQASKDTAAEKDKQIVTLQREAAENARQASIIENQRLEALATRDTAHTQEKRKLEALLAKANEDTLAAVNREDEATEAAAARIAALAAERDSLSATIQELKALLVQNFEQPTPSSPASSFSSPVRSQAPPGAKAPRNELVLTDPSRPVIFFEMGELHCRIGVYNPITRQMELRFACPTYTASPKQGKSPESIVAGASFLAGPAYKYFRESGLFVGEDARYMLFDHPDAGLRGSLVLDPPALQGGRIVDAERFAHIVDYCFRRFTRDDAAKTAVFDEASAQIIFSYKLSFQMPDFGVIGETLFDRMNCSQVCLLNEAALKLATQESRQSCILVDIGASCTTVYPSYERIILNNAVASTAVGGEHVTERLALLLAGKLELSSDNSSQLPRRRLEAARRIKEQSAFVAESFDEAVEMHGSFNFDRVKVMSGATESERDESSKGPNTANHKGAQIPDISISIDVSLSDGTTISVSLGVERFHSAEVLFQPSLLEGSAAMDGETDAEAPIGIVETILEATQGVDESVREEVCSCIVLSGRTALLPGIVARLKRDLQSGMSSLGVEKFDVVLAERSESPSTSWDGAELRVRNVQDGRERLEEQNFVSAESYSSTGAQVFNVVAFSY